MSSGGGTTTSTTTQKSDPWGPAQPYLQDIMSQAQGLYNTQKGQTDYAPFNTVTPQSATTLQGLDLTAQRALNGSPVTQAAGSALTGILNGNGTSPGDAYTEAGTRGNVAAPLATNFANGGGPGSGTLSMWADPSNINPYLTQQYQAASRPVIDSINAQFSQAGRTGSAANQDVLARNLGELSSNIFSAGYENAANRSLNAAQNMQGNALQGTSLLGGMSSDQANRYLTAGSQFSNNANTATAQKLQAANLAPLIAGQDYTDLQNLLNVGGAKDAQSAAQIQDLLTRWSYGNTQPWNILQQYGGAVSGLGGLIPASTSGTSTQTQPKQSMIPSLLGAGLTLGTAGSGSIFGKMFGL